MFRFVLFLNTDSMFPFSLLSENLEEEVVELESRIGP